MMILLSDQTGSIVSYLREKILIVMMNDLNRSFFFLETTMMTTKTATTTGATGGTSTSTTTGATGGTSTSTTTQNSK
jgi:hypothetical protein